MSRHDVHVAPSSRQMPAPHAFRTSDAARAIRDLEGLRDRTGLRSRITVSAEIEGARAHPQ